MAFKKIEFHIPTFATLIHKGENFAHVGYLSAVGYEAHGLYQKGALVLLVFVLASFFVKTEGH